MKLETAQRKLWPHRRRWSLTIRPDDEQHVWIEADIRCPSLLPVGMSGRWVKQARGLANAMNLMAETLDAVEKAAETRRYSTALEHKASILRD